MVSRRRALQALGSTLALAGCVGGSPTDTGTPTGDPTPGPTPTADTGSPTEPSESPTDSEGEPPEGFDWAVAVGAEIPAVPVVHGGLVLVANGAGVVRALAPDSGAERWRFEAPNGIGGGAGEPFVVHGDTLFVTSGDSRGTGGRDYATHALDPSSGEKRWEYSVPDGSWQGVLGPAADGVVITEGDDAIGPNSDRSALVGFDGTERWVAETGSAQALADGGRVAIGAYGAIRAFDADSGEQAWRVDATPAYLGLAADDSRVYGAEESRADSGPHQRLVARDGASGEKQWANDWYVTSLHRHGSDGVVAGGKHVVAYAPDGTERWRYEAGGSIYGPFHDGTAFVGPGNRVVALSLDDGTENWSATVDAENAAPSAYGDGVVVSRNYDTATYFAHDATNGSELWSVDLDGDHLGDAAVGAGVAVFRSGDGRLLGRRL